SGTGLGILRREARSSFRDARPLGELPPWVRARLADGPLVTIAKTLAEAPVHRRAHMDDVGVKQLDVDGRGIGERRFLGLFTSKAYGEEAAEIPLLRRTLRQILGAEQVVPGSHDYKEVVAVFNALPKPALLASTTAEARGDVDTVLAAGRTDEVVLTLRTRPETGRAVVLVVMPRESFSSDARDRIRALLAARLGGAP